KGEFKNGQMEGKGEIFYKSGSRYVGQVKDGKKEGEGEWTLSNGTVLKGRFKGDSYAGSAETQESDPSKPPEKGQKGE
ncbi:MAG TPA: hypothetical protein PKA91_16550, partial [Leptospiraceae bacterium]|nr:hypothetical protein [Leptospiraceae bacterium]